MLVRFSMLQLAIHYKYHELRSTFRISGERCHRACLYGRETAESRSVPYSVSQTRVAPSCLLPTSLISPEGKYVHPGMGKG